MKKVSVFMDVEDPINPLADDAALELALLFTEAGVRGSFCLTGEKCRTLQKRGRTDVVEAFRPHCLGLHTDTHSVHPTTMELLADLDFEEGCEAALNAERKGFDAFTDLFGRRPAFWGGAGNTWSPEITEALKHLGIPAYVYALTAIPCVHRFNGVTALPQHLSIAETDWMDDARAAAQSEEIIRMANDIFSPWVGVFVGHPTKMRYAEYWDTPYNAGRTPPTPEYTEPVPDEAYERAKANLRDFLKRLGQSTNIVGVDEALALEWRFYPPSKRDRDVFVRWTTDNLRSAAKWPIHRPDLDPSKIVSKTMSLAHTLEIGEL